MNTFQLVLGAESLTLIATVENKNKGDGKIMLFGPGILIAGGSCIAVAVLDRIAEDCGIQWLSTSLKLVLPIVAMAASIYFLETNAILGWLR
jgi:hypothetical protein